MPELTSCRNHGSGAPLTINQLAGELRREIDAATAEPAPLLSRLARRVRLAVSMGSPAEGAAACINVMINGLAAPNIKQI
jgi:uncharacterized membrane protein